MTNKCPFKKVKIDSKNYTLVPIDKFFESGPFHFGEINYRKQEILYSVHQHRENLEDTIIHESVHGIDVERQTELTEEQVSALSSGLHGWMKSNEALVLWILGRDRDGTKFD